MGMGMRLAGALGIVAVMALVAGVTSAADMSMSAGAQLKIAIAEARAAAGAGTLKSAQDHLQAVVNCIEGPGGAMFKKAMMSGGASMGGAMMTATCEGRGNGILPDARASGARWARAVAYVELANENAAIGLKATAVARARAAAYASLTLLQQAERSAMGR
ncbi:MAG: hypothetical protein QN125_07775 [Armatimonadota bacterium]|nr:hypothetical protein [Armatimonadota bacterium]MDR7422406.1 hypothetical protein [Armatimonadota bacterium]MDR7457168.1 hypothetical protein [Armatimonadota bacterium]